MHGDLHRKSAIGSLAAALLAMAIGLCGCGGGGNGGGARTARVSFAISWPQRSRAIAAPASALSFVLTIPGAKAGGGDLIFGQDRPAGTAATAQNYETTDSGTVGIVVNATIKFFAMAGGRAVSLP
jgi:hypothetical protein